MSRLFSLLLIVCCLSSCSRYYYKPNGVNAPMLTTARDAHLAANTTNDGSFVNVQGAYSPINHLGIIGTFNTYAYKASNPDAASGNVDASARLAELGAGYYYTMGKKVKLLFDIYGGGGFGSMQSDVDMSVFRGFVHPGVGIRTPYFEFVFNYRLSALKYYNLNANGHDSTYLQQQNLVYGNGRRIDNTGYLFAEPAVTMRGGYKFIKLQAQFVTATAISHVPWEYNNSIFTVGATFELEDLLKIINNNKTVAKKAH